MTPDEYLQLATEHILACPLCGSGSRLPVHDQDRAGFPATSVMCPQCGLVYITPRLSAESYAEFYRSGEYRQIGKTFSPDSTLESRRDCQDKYAASVSSLLKQTTSGNLAGTFLDIGGSIGATAARLQQDFGLRGTVLEPSDEERHEAEKAGLATIAGTFDDWEPSERYDVVGLFQTVDHLLHPSESLLKIRQRIIKDTGWLLVDCVDFRFLATGLGSLAKAVKIDHPCAFTSWNLHCLLERCGFFVQATADWSETVTLEFDGYEETISRKRLFFCRPQGVYGSSLPDARDVYRLGAIIGGVRNYMAEREAVTSG